MQAAQSLSRSGADVLLIDRNTYHTFIPLLYQVAAAQLEPESVAYPIRTLIRRSTQLHFRQAEVQHIDFKEQRVETTSERIYFDYLVLATGGRTQYLGVPGAREYAFPLKTLTEAVVLRNHILQRLEQASQEQDLQRRQHLLNLVIVGGGPTGVEMAGTLVELKQALKRDYPDLDLGLVKIILVHSGEQLLPGLPGPLGDYTLKKLHKLGVQVFCQTRVVRVTPTSVVLQGGEMLETTTVIWAAGLVAAVPATSPGVETAHKQKLRIKPTLQLQDYYHVYAIGDLAVIEDRPLSGVAPEALQQGVAVARNIRRQMQGKSPQPFRYFNKGRLAIIGCFAGVGKIGPFLLTGFLPWILWLGVHLVYLPGFRSRFIVLVNWLHGYLWRDRAIRLIFPSALSHPLDQQPPDSLATKTTPSEFY
ncbi:MAG: NAD(P)/FAD-dependent oxidoreductase [Synechococcaceae cyanobacterium SM2_3_1]|nr:NAD(P)/FAD-dependent oxidoreductase [Synechococcaceae cyanobacterium SM2_3_1]